jgi:hypothetical protein
MSPPDRNGASAGSGAARAPTWRERDADPLRLARPEREGKVVGTPQSPSPASWRPMARPRRIRTYTRLMLIVVVVGREAGHPTDRLRVERSHAERGGLRTPLRTAHRALERFPTAPRELEPD